jgi:Ca2+-binding RTX toxin-like protein
VRRRPPRIGAKLGLTAGLVLVATAGTARASTVAIPYWTGPPPVEFVADPSEVNRVEADIELGRVTVTDSGSLIRPGKDSDTDLTTTLSTCTFLGHQASCSSSQYNTASVDLGAGDDTYAGSGAAGTNAGVSGGAGDDSIHGGPGYDNITGGPGADDMHGGGGAGDEVTYSGDAPAVTVTLDDVANDGAAGEGDNVHSDVEGAGGTDGDDTLIGNGAANSLYGVHGSDLLVGRGGADNLFSLDPSVLRGGAGADSIAGHGQIAGGPDDDWIAAATIAGDVIDCGSGDDTVVADASDHLANCEHVSIPG